MATIPTGRFVWFEVVTKDPQKAQGFLGELFHWKTKQLDMGGHKYTMLLNGEQQIGGVMPTPQGAPPHAHWLTHLQVQDVAATCKLIRSLGGKVRKEPEKMSEMGTMAIVADPWDATFALWQPGKAEGTGDYSGKPGAWCWNELTTPEPDKAVEFYSKIGGFTEQKMDMGEHGHYHILNSDGKGRAGLSKPMQPGIPSMWTPYVHVSNADQTTEKAKKLGANIHVGPMDIPGVGRFSIFTDANAGTLGILQPNPQ